MDENLHLMYNQLVLPQKPIDNLSYMGEYKKGILHIYHAKEEDFLLKDWPLLWRMMIAVNNKITPVSYADLATLNMKTNGHKSLGEVLSAMQPKICIVWGINHLPEDEGVEKHTIVNKDGLQLAYANEISAYEESDAKKEIWGMFNEIFKK